MTPWEVLGIAEGESDPEVVRRAYERRLGRFGDIGEARSWIESAYQLLKADPSGADPYGLLEDPWGKWDEILASRPDPVAERPPHRVAVPEPEPEPQPEPEPVVPQAPEPLAVDEEELPPRSEREQPEPEPKREALSDYEMRFRAAANETDAVTRANALRAAAHDLADAMARNPSLVPLWARLVLTCCGRASGMLPQVVRRQDLALDLAVAGGAVTDALIEDGVRRSDFRLLRFIAGMLLRQMASDDSMDTARLAFRVAGYVALARPQTARNLLLALRERGKLAKMLEADRRKLERRIRAGEEMNLWSPKARMAIAAAELEGHWSGEASGAGTQQALAGLRALKELGGDQSELLRLVKERTPTMLHAALRAGQKRKATRTTTVPRPKRQKLSTRWREAIQREEGYSEPRGSRRGATKKSPIGWIIFIVIFLIFALRVCG
jgi:hypothetical protein